MEETMWERRFLKPIEVPTSDHMKVTLEIKQVPNKPEPVMVPLDPNAKFGEWQPIATAPTDGTFVLITDGATIEVGKNPLGMGWWDLHGLDFDYGHWDYELTHWMPLPPLPAKLPA